MPTKITKAFNLAKQQIKTAKDFFNKEDIDNSIYYIWLSFENLTNTLKDSLNGRPTQIHKEKIVILKNYYLIKQLNKDYSKTFKELERHRLAAGFGPYSNTVKNYTKDDVKGYLEDIESLLREAEASLKKRGIIETKNS